jgi:MFS family permease
MKKSKTWVIIFLFSLGWVFMYADRTILPPLMGIIGSEWGLDKVQLGLMSTVFFLGYAAMQIPAGFLADRIGRVKVLVTGYIFFGIATFLSGLAPGFAVFLAMRILTGLGEGTYYGPQYAISSNNLPEKYRGVASALINSGSAVGISLGFIASSYLTFTLHKSWQFVFYTLAIPTVMVALMIAFFIKDNHKAEAKISAEKYESGIKHLFTRNHILTYILIFCSLYGFFGMLTWLPYYLQTIRGLQGTQTGIIASLVPWASIPGALLFGFISDRLKNKKPLILFLVIVGALCQFVIPYVESYSLMLFGLVIYGMMGKLALDPVLISFVAENTPSHMYSRAYGFYNFSGMLSSIFAPYITGYVAQVTGKVEGGFYLSGVLLLVGGLLFMFTKSRTSTLPQKEPVVSETTA